MGIKVKMREYATPEHEKAFMQRGVRAKDEGRQYPRLDGGAPCTPWRVRGRVYGLSLSLGSIITSDGRCGGEDAQRAAAGDEKDAGVFFRVEPFVIIPTFRLGRVVERDARYRPL